MKRTTPAILVIVAMTVAPALAGGTSPADGSGMPTGCAALLDLVSALPPEEVSAAEESDLVYMREEEKLARDVYLALDDLWGLRAFGNIRLAEQSHMDALLALLDRYGISDPVGTNPPGSFTDSGLGLLFTALLEQGTGSLVDALLVGATIEDKDIFDLTAALERADSTDIRLVYQNLRKASRNHLRSFVGLLAANGAAYEPQYLDTETFEAIVGSPPERGVVDAEGLPIPSGCRGGRRGGPSTEDAPRTTEQLRTRDSLQIRTIGQR